MNVKFILYSILFSSCLMKAQTVTPTVYSNGGNYNSASGGSISWTVGEPISETYTTSTNKSTMGFHQPELNIASIIKEQGVQKDLLVYPNPVKETLTVNFNDLEKGNYKLQLLDAVGKILNSYSLDITNSNTKRELNITSYSEGIHFIKITSATFNKTVRITINH